MKSVLTSEQIKEKLIYGDYQIAAKMLNISADNARMRFNRGDKKIAEILQKIVENRDNLLLSAQESVK